jgi:site-specific DNA-methyltransferase (adenine-specific)
MNFTIHQGDNRDILKTIPDNSIDAIITDPPYGIDFLGKAWDANTGALETYMECLRVLKPGGYILAFSAARTYHHLAVTLEQAGFEIRDQLMWLYSSGFPKAQDIGKAIQKRQGVEETKTHNTLNGYAKEQTSHGAQRVGDVNKDDYENTIKETVCTSPQAQQWAGWKTALKPAHEPIAMARKPFKGSTIDNVLAHGVGALNIDATRIPNPEGDRFPSNVIGEVEGYQKYFYCPKVSRKERHCGFEMPPALFGQHQGAYDENGERYAVQLDARTGNTGNNHPTVKPVELMKYLIKLVTLPNSTVLDPFTGSGSTGMAAVELGHEFIGCELDPEYVKIAETRISAWNTEEYDNNFGDLFETE